MRSAEEFILFGKIYTDLMKVFRVILLIVLFIQGCSSFTPLQRSRFLTVSHLIDTAKYAEAKELVEEMTVDEQFTEWPRTWYARGLLAQTAYRDGRKNNDRKKFELYPDQLFVAYESFEKAISLDSRGGFDKQLAPKYVLLANDLQDLGRRSYTSGNYKEALRAFEHALNVTQSPILTVQPDTNLIYNAALAAYESQTFDRAVKHLDRLHGYSYSINVTHLLSNALLQLGDTLAASKVLRQGVERFENNDGLIMLLSDLLFHSGNTREALRLLEKGAEQHPDKHIFNYTRGLVYQKTEQYNDAILAYMEAVAQAPDELIIYANIATCYYNIGVEIDEDSRHINSNREVQIERARAAAAFESAVLWLDKTYEKETDNREVVTRLSELYRLLNVQEKARDIEERIE